MRYSKQKTYCQHDRYRKTSATLLAFELSLKQQSKVAFNPKREKQRYLDFQNACKGMLCMEASECLNIKVGKGKYLRFALQSVL